MHSDSSLLGTSSLLLISWMVLGANLLQDLQRNEIAATEDPFQLTLSIEDESYSTSFHSLAGEKRSHVELLLVLRLRFTNQTQKAVKIQKDCVRLDSTVIYDSPIVGPSEPLLPGGMISNEGQGCPYVASEKLLVILPGKFYEATLKVHFEVINHGNFHPPKSLRPGEYFLQISATTWWEIEGQDEEFNKKWRRPGVLVGRSVRSELMGFEVEAKPVKWGVRSGALSL